MTKEEISALLGRPLTSVEEANFTLYFNIAKETLQTLICSDLCGNADKIYDIREGYSTVFTDIFTDVFEVKVDGTTVDSSTYSIRQNNKRSGSWYNSLVFNERFTNEKEIEVSATWGFKKYPYDLQMILAGLFDLITKKNKLNPTVASKQTEDFRISFNTDVDLNDAFYTKYSATIDKYSICNIGYTRSGGVC